MNANFKVDMEIKEVAMIPEPHLTMEEAVEKLKELGHDIISVENDTRKIIVKHG